MKQSIKDKPSILFKIYQLIAIQLLMVASTITAVYFHNQQLYPLNAKLGNFDGPAIYQLEGLAATLDKLAFELKLNPNAPEQLNIRNPSFTIDSQLAAINDIENRIFDSRIDKSHRHLQHEAKTLLDMLQMLTMGKNIQTELFLKAITATRFRVEQLRRLHYNDSEILRIKLEQLNKENFKLHIYLSSITLLVFGLLIAPLVLNIRGLVRTLQTSEETQRGMRESAEHEKNQMTALLSAMKIGVLFEDKSGVVDFVNPAFKHLWGMNDHVFINGCHVKELFLDLSSRFAISEHTSKHVLQAAKSLEISEPFEIELIGGNVLTQQSFPVLSDDKNFIGRLWIYEDVTHERQTAQQLLYLAEHDPLTGLNNRHSFQKHLDYMIKNAMRNETRFALLYFDLDEFKYINDNFGHGTGDEVLLQTAAKVNVLIREVDMFARLGGDEFAILLSLNPEENPGALPERIIKTIAAIPFRFSNNNFRLTASIGVAVYPDHGADAEELVAHADSAMYHAKRLGKNSWVLYTPESDQSESMIERMNWSRRIDLALEQNLLELYFQGIYRTANNQPNHLEVLVRMRDPEDISRIIMPSLFIPFAEKTGQIVEMDRWILSHAIELMAKYPLMPSLAVNISGRSIDETSLPLYIKDKLFEHEVSPERLLIELTETATVSDMNEAQRFIEAINQLGCRICLDDFGSGFSTFMYLKYLNVDILKIDGIFVKDLTKNRENQLFIQALVNVAKGLNKSIIAEHVEDSETYALLNEFGVDYAQGFFLDIPISQEELIQRLAVIARTGLQD